MAVAPDASIACFSNKLFSVDARMAFARRQVNRSVSWLVTIMKNVHMDQVTRDEWRQSGFFYDCDEHNMCWRFVGSRDGLMRFVEILESYAANPGNEGLSEHEHYGPYWYLKLVTSQEPEITDSAICGTLIDFQRLAESIKRKLDSSVAGSTFAMVMSIALAARALFNLKFEKKVSTRRCRSPIIRRQLTRAWSGLASKRPLFVVAWARR